MIIWVTDLSSGYSQVLKAETDTSTVYYTRGFELISRREGATASYYIYDGGFSVRALTNESGTVTDTLVFDAFGNETGHTGTTDNSYGFQGEEQDATGLYYLRARYMDPATGTFTTMDTYGGSLSDPMSLHKYLFANANPVMYTDPSGHFSLAEMDAAMAIDIMLDSSYISGFLYIVDAQITDPNLEHHDILGYFGAVGFGFIFSGLSLMLSSFVTGALVLAVINTVFASMGVAKGIQDFDNGHVVYGPLEVVVSVVGCAVGWKCFADAYCVAGYEKTLSSNSFDEPHYKTTTDNNPIVWDGKDPYVPELANAIENKFPGRVQAVEKIVYLPDGVAYTDLDIELDYVVIQVKSGKANGLTRQMVKTAIYTGKTVISYTPDINQSSAVLKGVRQYGFHTFTTINDILKFLAGI